MLVFRDGKLLTEGVHWTEGNKPGDVKILEKTMIGKPYTVFDPTTGKHKTYLAARDDATGSSGDPIRDPNDIAELSGADPKWAPIDLTNATDIKAHYLFDGNLLDGSGNALHLSGTKSYATIGGNEFVYSPFGTEITRGGTNDVDLRISGKLTVSFLAQLSIDRAEQIILCFGVPGTNAAGTNYAWGLAVQAEQTIQAWQEHTSSGLQRMEFGVGVRLDVAHYIYTRTDPDGSDNQTHTLYINGESVGSQVSNVVPNDLAGTQQLRIGELGLYMSDLVIAEDVWSADFCAAAHKQVRHGGPAAS